MAAKEASCKILVVDSYRDAADSMGEILSLFNHDVKAAYSGPEAIRMAQEFRPDVIITELVLSDLDGLRVARLIRGSLGDVLLIAVTGIGQEHYRELAFEAGFDYYFIKPVEYTNLLDTIRARKPERPDA